MGKPKARSFGSLPGVVLWISNISSQASLFFIDGCFKNQLIKSCIEEIRKQEVYYNPIFTKNQPVISDKRIPKTTSTKNFLFEKDHNNWCGN